MPPKIALSISYSPEIMYRSTGTKPVRAIMAVAPVYMAIVLGISCELIDSVECRVDGQSDKQVFAKLGYIDRHVCSCGPLCLSADVSVRVTCDSRVNRFRLLRHTGVAFHIFAHTAR